jgi:hypothetical protein
MSGFARDFDDFTAPEREAIKLARSVDDDLTARLAVECQTVVREGVAAAHATQLRRLGATAFVLARRLGPGPVPADEPRPAPLRAGPNLITDLTVRLTLNSDPTDVFDEAEQLVELKERLAELASVEIVGIERTRR